MNSAGSQVKCVALWQRLTKLQCTFYYFSRVKLGKPVPVRHLPDPTRTRPDPYPRVRVGSGKPAGTGIPAVLYCTTTRCRFAAALATCRYCISSLIYFHSGESCRQLRDEHGRAQRTCDVSDGMLRIHRLLHPIPYRPTIYCRLQQRAWSWLWKLVLQPPRVGVHQQHHQPVHLRSQVPRFPVRRQTFDIQTETKSTAVSSYSTYLNDDVVAVVRRRSVQGCLLRPTSIGTAFIFVQILWPQGPKAPIPVKYCTHCT